METSKANIALKEHNLLAQGEALGNTHPPHCALKGRNHLSLNKNLTILWHNL